VSWSGRRVLVTGHTGFKGGWLALWLHRLGAEVTGFGAAPPTEPSLFALARVGDAVQDVRGDVRDAEAVQAAVARARPEAVFHLAAQPLVRRSLRAPSETYAVNVLGTAHVLDAVRAAGGAEAIVVVTSDKCYAPAAAPHPHREGDPLGGDDPYSSSKAAQEHVAAAYREAYGLPLATARAGNAIGGGDWAQDRLVPDLVRAAASGGAATVRHRSFVRPWQHLLNPLAGYVRLAERLLAGEEVREAWNFGPAPGDERPVGWLVDRFRERWPGGLEVAGAPEPEPTVEAAALRLDSAKARERLGWAPAWDLEAGLDATVAWYAGQLAGEDPRALTEAQIDRFEAASLASSPP
jgi:CDP-glucose 4,6-dehydratase